MTNEDKEKLRAHINSAISEVESAAFIISNDPSDAAKRDNEVLIEMAQKLLQLRVYINNRYY